MDLCSDLNREQTTHFSHLTGILPYTTTGEQNDKLNLELDEQIYDFTHIYSIKRVRNSLCSIAQIVHSSSGRLDSRGPDSEKYHAGLAYKTSSVAGRAFHQKATSETFRRQVWIPFFYNALCTLIRVPQSPSTRVPSSSIIPKFLPSTLQTSQTAS